MSSFPLFNVVLGISNNGVDLVSTPNFSEPLLDADGNPVLDGDGNPVMIPQ